MRNPCTETPKYKVLVLAEQKKVITMKLVKPICFPRKPKKFLDEMCREGLLVKVADNKYKIGKVML